MKSEGRRIHGLAGQAREAGEHLKALQLSDEAMLAYQRDGDTLGFTEIIADRGIVLRHLYDDTSDKNFLYLAKAELTEAVRIARELGNKEALALPIYQLGNVEEALGNYSEAIKCFQETIDNTSTEGNNPNSNSPAHNRPAYLATMKAHLAYAEYKNGDKSAKVRMIQATQESEQAEDVDPTSKDTWVSGNYMSLAGMLKEDAPEEAREYLQKAKEIIDDNPKLTIRKAQWEKLSQTF